MELLILEYVSYCAHSNLNCCRTHRCLIRTHLLLYHAVHAMPVFRDPASASKAITVTAKELAPLLFLVSPARRVWLMRKLPAAMRVQYASHFTPEVNTCTELSYKPSRHIINLICVQWLLCRLVFCWTICILCVLSCHVSRCRHSSPSLHVCLVCQQKQELLRNLTDIPKSEGNEPSNCNPSSKRLC